MDEAQLEVRLSAPDRLVALIDTGLDAVPDLELDRFVGVVCKVLGVPVSLVSLVDPERQFFPGARGLGAPWDGQRQTALSHSFCQQVVASGQPLVITDARDDPRFCDNPAIQDLGVVGYAGMPLTDQQGNILGSLCAIDHQPRAWTEHEADLLSDLAAACSAILRLRISNMHAERSRAAAESLAGQVHTSLTHNQLLLRASSALNGTSTVAEVIAEVGRLVTGSLDPAHVGVALLDDSGKQVRLTATDRLPAAVAERWERFPAAADLPAAAVIRSGQQLLLANPAEIRAAYPHLDEDLDQLGWQALACTPLLGLNGVLGSLRFAWKEPHATTVEEQATITTLATYVAHALERATHLRERTIAATTLQRALLSPLPPAGAVRLAARYQPAHHDDLVGGDWYDAVPLPGGRLALVIGDVCGHNVAAAAAMSELRSMLRGFLIDHNDSPAALLTRLEHANEALGDRTVATILVAYLDPADGGYTLRWSNAGHPPPVLLHPGGQVTSAPACDPLFGSFRTVTRTDHVHQLPHGTTVLLHTDGLVESHTSIDDGFDRVHRLLAEHPDASPDELADHLLRLTTPLIRPDDIALLIAHCR